MMNPMHRTKPQISLAERQQWAKSHHFHITARSEVDAEALPPDGSTPGMDRTMEWLTAGAGLEPGYRMPRVIED